MNKRSQARRERPRVMLTVEIRLREPIAAMSANVDPSPYAPPAVARAAAKNSLQLLPIWVWLFPGLGLASAPFFVGLAAGTPEFRAINNLPPAIVLSSMALICLLGAINNFRRATFAWSNGDRISGWWCASLATFGAFVFLALGVGAAQLAWSLRVLSFTDFFAP